MNCFAGIIAFDGRPGQREEERLLSILGRHGNGRPTAGRAGNALFVQTGEAPSPGACRGLFALDARLDNAAEIAAAAGCDPRDGDARLVRRTFETRGEDGIALILGAFAFAHWDEDSRRLTLARDCLGRKPLFFHRHEGFVAFASHLPDLLAMPEVPRQIDEVMIASFLALDHRETARTLYEGIDRVPTRSIVELTPGGTKVRRYWQPRLDAPPPYARDEDYVARARELFDRAVARCLRDTPRVAIFTSGGFDSSAVAATVARLGHGDATCYTGVPPEGFALECAPNRYLDERPKVRALMDMYPRLASRLVAPTGSDFARHDAIEWFLRAAIPSRNASNLNWFASIRNAAAADGHDVVLMGTMGNYGLSWEGNFSLTALARAGHFGTLIRETRAVAKDRDQPVWRVVAGELVLRAAPRPAQRLATRLRGCDPDDIGRFSLLRKEAVETLGLRARWRENGFDPWYRTFGSVHALRAHQIFDQLQTARDTSAMSEAATGTQVRDPHADRELIEFCLSVPEWLYRRNGVRRSFAREVLADRLPPEILQENRRGEQAPNWFDGLTARRPMIESEVERLEASTLANRLIDVPRLKRLIATWPSDASEAQARMADYRLALDRAVHVGQFIRWVEGGNN